MTFLVGSIAAERLDTMCARAAAALVDGCDLAELRLDALRGGGPSIESLAGRGEHGSLPAGQWIATCRPVAEGGQSRSSVEHRVPQLLSALRAGAWLIDFELSDWKRYAMARHDIAKALADRAVTGHAPGLVISHHDVERRPANVHGLVQEMRSIEAARAFKLAWPAADILSNFDALDILRDAGDEAIAVCMGEAGLMSRILAGKLGAFATYCAPDADSATAPGQLTLAELRDRYRWESINEATEVYGVIGYPVAQSIGPDVFNDAFRAAKINAVYLPLRVEPTERCFSAFLDGCLERDWLDVRGFSVTAPHKLHALRYLGDRADPPADVIGAVNTLRIEDGEITGCNTDCDAAVDTLLAGMQCGAEDLDGVPVDLLGAGGAARAVAAGLADCGCKITLYNRDATRARALAESIGCSAKSWDERSGAEGKILVNCTNVGMWPDAESSPMPADALRAETVVFDTVYRPLETRLLRDAAAAGCTVVRGWGMFVRQAGMQFEYWTHQPADYQRLAATVADALKARD